MVNTIVLPKIWTVYRIRNIANGKCYVGVTKRSLRARWNNHVAEAKLGKNWWMSMAIRKYGPENFTISLLAIANTRPEAMAIEKQLIIQLRSQAPSGYNMTDGGEGVWRRPRPSISEETREKLRLAHLGKTLPSEHRDAIREGVCAAGIVRSPETRAKMSASAKIRKRRPFSIQARANIKAAAIKSAPIRSARLKGHFQAWPPATPAT